MNAILDEIIFCIKKEKKNFLLYLTKYANGGVVCTLPIYKGGFARLNTENED